MLLVLDWLLLQLGGSPFFKMAADRALKRGVNYVMGNLGMLLLIPMIGVAVVSGAADDVTQTVGTDLPGGRGVAIVP